MSWRDLNSEESLSGLELNTELNLDVFELVIWTTTALCCF